MKYYLDTAIWMDYYEDRKDLKNNIGEFAFKLLSMILASKNKIVVSTFLLKELESNYPIDKIRGLTFHFEKSMIKVDVSEQQMKEAKKICFERKIPRGDVIHAILARDNNAIRVTRDKHFQLLKDICIMKKPEELI